MLTFITQNSLARVPLRMLQLLIFLVLLAACSPRSLPFTSPERPALLPLVSVANGLLSWSPDSSAFAYAGREVRIYHLDRGVVRKTKLEKPQVLAWGKPGVAAAYSSGERFDVQLLDAQGAVHEVLSGPGRVVAMAWGGDTLYVMASQLKQYTFGVNQRTSLYPWTPAGAQPAQLLADVTLKPSTPRQLGDDFPLGPCLQVSPYGDEVVYSRLHDPPAFNASYRVVVRHLATGQERVLGNRPVGSVAEILMTDGEHLLLNDGSQALSQVELWSGKRNRLFDFWPEEVAAAGDLLYVNGTLYRGQHPLWSLEQTVPGIFSPDGRHLLLVGPGDVYLVDVDTIKQDFYPTPELLKLRRLRSLGLINTDDFERMRKEMR